ncbi:MAG: diaminopimelate epimerase [Alphaproteobacteria bacterium]|nr:diaminopimelate epimerase [Alphaproteobacteria bacterium]
MDGLPFIKMHGLGNDFVIIDGRGNAVEIGADAARRIADRRTGVGCDQLIVLGRAKSRDAEAFMSIRNADGGESAACGNATRCVAALLMTENGTDEAVIETDAGILVGQGAPGGITVDMGPPGTRWQDIPLAEDVDTLHLPLAAGPVSDPAACSMGNPHATFFVEDLNAIDIPAIGPGLEHDPLFPERANIGFAQILAPDRLRLRVWERGAGLTAACATGACAAVVNGARRGLVERGATCVLDGGELLVEWRGEDDHVLMTGPIAVAFTGRIAPALLNGSAA